MPTARVYDESSYGVTLYKGSPDTRVTFTSSPFDWLEASLYYTKIEDRPYCDQVFDEVCNQSYKDKGFNFKLRIKEEGKLPAIAIGINDLGGTGLYSSEYLVASYGIDKLDFHFGLGWGALNGSDHSFKNPLTYVSDSFNTRTVFTPEDTGQLNTGSLFSGESVSPFFGLSYILNRKTILKFEYDSTLTSGSDENFFGSPDIGYENAKYNFSMGIDYQVNENFSIGISHERGNTTSLKFIYKRDSSTYGNKNSFKTAKIKDTESKYTKLRRNLENNGIGVNRIEETADAVGLELTQFIHPNFQVIEEIIKAATLESGIDKDVKTNIKIADLTAYQEYDEKLNNDSKLIYQKTKKRGLNSDTSLTFRPYIAAREGFLKFAALIENNSEYIFSDNLFFSSNLKYSIWDNFDDLIYPPKDTYPAQVRSDVKDYLRNFNDGVIIGRAQLDGYKTISPNNHLMFSAGIFEEMFSGFGFEYLHFKNESNHAYGFELFQAYKRDYEMQFGLLDYKQITGHFNYYYRNYGSVPFDLKASYGKYLAGDIGGTIEVSRTFSNGVRFGVFATFTDVSTEQFGEGSFDKGIFFNIPIFGNMVNYSWRPLTKDPGQKLIRKNNLHDLLVKFSPINWDM